MADPTHKPDNKFFLTKEDSAQHGGARIFFKTHVPRMLTLDDARTLANDLLALAGPDPVIAAHCGLTPEVVPVPDPLAGPVLIPAEAPSDIEPEPIPDVPINPDPPAVTA